MDPLLALGSLSTDVEHTVGQVTNDEGGLGDTSGLYSRSQHILIVGDIIWLRNAVYRVEIAGAKGQIRYFVQRRRGDNLLFGRVVELVLSGALETLLDTSILPQNADGIADLGWEVVAFNLGGLHENGLNVILGSLIVKGKFQGLHSLEDDTHRLHCVAEDDFLE